MLFRQRGPGEVAVQTPAKLNLFLEVFGKRPDGYHELETLMVSVGLYDTLVFREEVTGSVELRCFAANRRGRDDLASGRVAPGGENLVVQAAELLRSVMRVDQGVRIDLYKRIPVAAGLAGGSSDAAATLAALNRMWKLNLSGGELQELASQLGSDVGFFLAPGAAAICRGRGQQVEPLEMPLGWNWILACPQAGLSTSAVYQHCSPAAQPQSVSGLADSLKRGRLHLATQFFYNALQEPAETLNADLAALKSQFSRQPVAGHMMSGSGTTYFGVTATRRGARVVASRLRARRVAHVFVVQNRP